MLNTYMMSNMAPQHCAFNRGTWLILEELVRHWAEEKKTIYVITGAVLLGIGYKKKRALEEWKRRRFRASLQPGRSALSAQFSFRF